MRSITAVAALAFALLATTSCVQRQGDFTVMSTKLVNLNEVDLDSLERQRGVVGVDKSHLILFIPTKLNPNIEDATNDALDKGDGDVMTDVVLERYWWTIIVYSQYGWRVKGDVVKTRK